jgi:hypothetical protein
VVAEESLEGSIFRQDTLNRLAIVVEAVLHSLDAFRDCLLAASHLPRMQQNLGALRVLGGRTRAFVRQLVARSVGVWESATLQQALVARLASRQRLSQPNARRIIELLDHAQVRRRCARSQHCVDVNAVLDHTGHLAHQAAAEK